MSFLKNLLSKRPSPPKLIVIGLDGTPYSFVQRMFSEGRMPNFQKLVSRGSIQRMNSVIPTISSVAWSTFMTGKNPAKHGIFGFVDMQKNSYEFTIPTSANMISKTLWEHLGDHGKRVIVMNVPETYPPRKVNGILVSGFLCTDITKGTHPPELGQRLKLDGYRIDVDAQQARKDKEALIKDIHLTLEKRFETFFRLMKEEKWDYLHLHIMCTDRLFHFLWEEMEQEDPHFGPLFYEVIAKIDGFLGELKQKMDATTDQIILSDHGFCTVKQDIYLNHWLKQEGYLKFEKDEPKTIADMSSETTAFSLIPGRIFINLKGKYPKGSVDLEEYEPLRTELTKKLLELRDPEGGERIIQRVYKKEEIYHGPLFDRAADLIAHPMNGYDLKGNVNKDRLGEKGPINGMHTYEDAFLYIKGKEINSEDFSIVDVMPTILDMMDVAKPPDLDGTSLI